MNIKKMISTILIVVGIVVLILFAIADRIGIGESPKFGALQIAGVIVGAILAVAGLFLLRRSKKPDQPASGQSDAGN